MAHIYEPPRGRNQMTQVRGWTGKTVPWGTRRDKRHGHAVSSTTTTIGPRKTGKRGSGGQQRQGHGNEGKGQHVPPIIKKQPYSRSAKRQTHTQDRQQHHHHYDLPLWVPTHSQRKQPILQSDRLPPKRENEYTTWWHSTNSTSTSKGCQKLYVTGHSSGRQQRER